MLARVKLKGIDGGPHKRWSMWFNSMQREEPYQGLTCHLVSWERDVFTFCFAKCIGGHRWCMAVVSSCRKTSTCDLGERSPMRNPTHNGETPPCFLHGYFLIPKIDHFHNRRAIPWEVAKLVTIDQQCQCHLLFCQTSNCIIQAV